MAKEVLPIDPQLVEAYRLAKVAADKASEALTEAQYQIFEAVKNHLPEKGTTHFHGIKVATALSSKWSQEKLDEIEKTWVRKSNLPFPFKKEWKEDGKAVSYIKENTPEAYTALSDALTLTPKKPTFELTEK